MTRSQACVPLPNLAMPNEGGLSAQRMRIIPRDTCAWDHSCVALRCSHRCLDLDTPSLARGVSQRVVSLPPHLKAFGKREQGSYVPGELAHQSQGSSGQVSKKR